MSALVADDLTPLLTLSSSTASALTSIAVAYIQSSFSLPPATAACKELISSMSLGVSHQVLSGCVRALAKLLAESAKRGHSGQFFRRALAPFALPEPVVKAVEAVYLESRQLISETVPSESTSTRQYADFSYRLDVAVNTRAISNTAAVAYTLRVDTADGGTVEFQSDAAMVRRMKEEVERAIEEEKGTHSQRFQRYMN